MEDKSAYTFFADEARDPFTYCNSDIYAKMIPLEKRENAVTKKEGCGMGRNLNQELKNAMDELGYIMEDMPEEFLQEKSVEEIHYVLKDGGLYAE